MLLAKSNWTLIIAYFQLKKWWMELRKIDYKNDIVKSLSLINFIQNLPDNILI